MQARFAVVLTVAVLAVPRASHACFMAGHNWRIVLGESRDGLVVLDLPECQSR